MGDDCMSWKPRRERRMKNEIVKAIEEERRGKRGKRKEVFP
jgi:hypothetical protein